MAYYLEKTDGLEVRVRVQPKASRTQLEGVRDDQIRVRLTAPPVDNAANQAIVEFMAKVVGIPKSRVFLTAGHKSRDKTLFMKGEAQDLLNLLEQALQGKAE